MFQGSVEYESIHIFRIFMIYNKNNNTKIEMYFKRFMSKLSGQHMTSSVVGTIICHRKAYYVKIYGT